jgi:hypothetical protein
MKMAFELYPASYTIYTVAGYTIKDDLQLYDDMYSLVTTDLTVQAWIDQKADLWQTKAKMTRDEVEHWMSVYLSAYQTALPGAMERFSNYVFSILGSVQKMLVIGKMLFDAGTPFTLKVKNLPSIETSPGTVRPIEVYAAMKKTTGVAAELLGSNLSLPTLLIGSAVALFAVGKGK